VTYRPAQSAKPSRRALALAWALALLGGLAGCAAFPGINWWFLAPVSAGLLFTVAELLGPWRGFGAAVGYGLVMFLPLIWWAHVAAGTLPWLALAAASAFFLGLAVPAYGYATRLLGSTSYLIKALLFALLFTAADTFRGVFPFGGFPWERFGFSQADSPLGRWGWVGGATLIAFTTAATGALLAGAIRHLRARRWRWAGGGVAAAVALLAVPLVFPLGTGEQAGTIDIVAVQGNVAVTEEGLFAHQREVLQNHVNGTLKLAQAGERPDVVLWPENATDIDPNTDQAAADAIDGAAQAIGAPILVGSIEYTDTGQRYNLGVLWEPGVGITDTYAKQHPAPFAEYIPARGFFRLFTKKVDLIAHDMLPGSKVGVIDLPVERLGRSVTMGDVICFEVADDAIVTQSVKAGAEFLVIQTNNASFGDTAESLQQLAMSRLRAIEHGRAVVQISTVGVSAVIAPDGTVLQQTGLFEAAEMVATLPLRTSLTPAAYLAPVLSWAFPLAGAALWLAGIGAAVAALAARRRRSRTGDAP
jgi:apolipoprotein N-acyltransferase